MHIFYTNIASSSKRSFKESPFLLQIPLTMTSPHVINGDFYLPDKFPPLFLLRESFTYLYLLNINNFSQFYCLDIHTTDYNFSNDIQFLSLKKAMLPTQNTQLCKNPNICPTPKRYDVMSLPNYLPPTPICCTSDGFTE